LNKTGKQSSSASTNRVLADLGLSQAFHRRREIEIEAAQLASVEPSVRGLYVVRPLTAEWLLGKDV
jgi:hypothetical protein